METTQSLLIFFTTVDLVTLTYIGSIVTAYFLEGFMFCRFVEA